MLNDYALRHNGTSYRLNGVLERSTFRKETAYFMYNRLDHIGIVVQSIDASLKTYCEQLGFRLRERVVIAEQGVEAAFLDLQETSSSPPFSPNSTIELIAPTRDNTGVAKFLQTRGEGMHHICYEVHDIQATLATLRGQGVRLIDETPRRGVHGVVAFVHPKATHGAMIELLQKDHHA